MNTTVVDTHAPILMVIISLMIMMKEFQSSSRFASPWIVTIIATVTIMLYWFTRNRAMYLPGIFILVMFISIGNGYSLYQWNRAPDTGECGIILPETTKYNTSQYGLYRAYYATSLVILSILCVMKLDKIDIGWERGKYTLVFGLPIIMPLLTELGNDITGVFTDSTVNPESLLLNFTIGDSTAKLADNWTHFTMTLILYVVLMLLAYINSEGLNGREESMKPIVIIITLMVFFSFIMKSIFIQDCSLRQDKNIQSDTTEATWPCKIEKYGGVTMLFLMSLLTALIYNIPKNTYKFLTFIIVATLSWAISATLMLTRE